MTRIPEPVDLLGVRIHPITREDLLEAIDETIRAGEKARFSNSNAHSMNLAAELDWFREYGNSARVNFCDGYGVLLGARLLGARIPERITYADAMWDFARLCAERGFSLYLLGAAPGVAERAAAKLVERFPSLRIAGFHHGFFDRSPGSAENRAVLDAIARARPDLLVVGLGMPLQERWILDNWDDLEARVVMNGGAVFDYVSGEVRRAPRWMTDHGLEWLGRLVIEPRRLWKRYLLGNPLFLARVLGERWRQGLRPKTAR